MATSVLNIFVGKDCIWTQKVKIDPALKFLNQIRKFWRPVEHLNEPLSPNDQSDEAEHKVSGKLESPPSDPKIDRNINGICEHKQLRNQNPHRIIIDHLSINSIRNKFESLVRFVGNNLDVLMVSETKVDDTFPELQFLIEGFSKPFRLDHTAKGGRILLYIKEDIPCRHIKQITLNNLFEGFFVELNWEAKNGYSDAHVIPIKKIASHLSNVSAAFDKLCADY